MTMVESSKLFVINYAKLAKNRQKADYLARWMVVDADRQKIISAV